MSLLGSGTTQQRRNKQLKVIPLKYRTYSEIFAKLWRLVYVIVETFILKSNRGVPVLVYGQEQLEY